ncbi:MAG: hypothetical protein KIT10_15340 [Flavobacteriales bacterium]|nr:hypothetical protein [Flavobacteriales bacterium]
MRTKQILLAGCMLLAMNGALAQPWDQGGNNIIASTDYLGCDGSSTIPLHLRTIPHLPIHFSTSDTLRMRINPYLPSVDVGEEWPGQNLSGFVGIGDFSTTVVNRPVSLLHLDHKGGVLVGWRPWMRTGTLCTLGSDLMYVGTKQEAPDRVDAVIGWADNLEDVSAFGPDALRFIFTRAPYLTGTAADTNGLEIARMIPDTSGNEGFLGLGDYFNAGLQPDERLDLLERTIRLRRLVPDYQSDSLDMVVVTDSTGRLHWRPLNTMAFENCAWTLQGPPGSNAHISTAYQGNPGCPQEDKGVGIGMVDPKFKLHVMHDFAESNNFLGGILSDYFAQSTQGTAIRGTVQTPPMVETLNIQPLTGVHGEASGSRNSTGLLGTAFRANWGPMNTAVLYGVRGESNGHGLASRSIGVYGRGSGATFSANNWGAYFEGRGFLGAAAWTYSDANLKTGIE